MAETAITRRIVKALRSRGAYVVKIHGDAMQVRGVPDLLACYRGRFVALEDKTKVGTPSELQEHTMAEIRTAGGTAIVARTVDDAMGALDMIDGSFL